VKRPAAAALVLAALVSAGCSPSGATSHDRGKVVLPAKRVTVPGRLYATKGRTLYRFSGARLTVVLRDTKVKDLAATPDGSRLAFAELQAQSSTIALADHTGQNRQTLTPASAPEGALWAFAPALSADGQRLVYLTDRGKLPSSPQNLQPNDLGLWMLDTTTGQSHRIAAPVPYTGGDSDPTFRPGADEQLLYTTYLYGGVPLQPVARLTWLSLRTGVHDFLSPDQARNFQPAISPDGRFAAFIHASATGDDLRVMPLAQTYGRDPQPYPTEAAATLQTGMVAQPVWAPDGSAIAFLKLVDGSFDLFILPVSTLSGTIQATGPAQAITDGSFLDADSRMAWTP
jgi:Tol biopolymer transport system component